VRFLYPPDYLLQAANEIIIGALLRLARRAVQK
jgi:hypothetical protein